MDKNLFQLEDLPNEILIEILKSLDIQELFQAFYNLNFRFNALLYSLNNLSFTLSRNNYNDFNLWKFPMDGISTLIITAEIHVDLERFTHLRCLIVLSPTSGLFQRLSSQ